MAKTEVSVETAELYAQTVARKKARSTDSLRRLEKERQVELLFRMGIEIAEEYVDGTLPRHPDTQNVWGNIEVALITPFVTLTGANEELDFVLKAQGSKKGWRADKFYLDQLPLSDYQSLSIHTVEGKKFIGDPLLTISSTHQLTIPLKKNKEANDTEEIEMARNLLNAIQGELSDKCTPHSQIARDNKAGMKVFFDRIFRHPKPAK